MEKRKLNINFIFFKLVFFYENYYKNIMLKEKVNSEKWITRVKIPVMQITMY